MPLKVSKFGGSSLADANQFRKVAAIVQADDERRVVVPSAPGKRSKGDTKITDMLYRCHELAARAESFDDCFAEVGERYHGIARELGLDVELAVWLESVSTRIASEAAEGRGPDYAASRGEAINGRLLAALLNATFIDAAELIRFREDGRSVDLEATQVAAVDAMQAADRLVVPGFYGSLPDGRIRTFSRGGSDVTGAILARVLDASVYENWTDVPGLLITDPGIVPEALPIESVTYRELRELSYSGATVLHEEAVFTVRDAGIPVHVRNTNQPEAAGTRIVASTDNVEAKFAITGIAGRRGFTAITLEKAMMNSLIGYGQRVLETVAKHGVSFEHMPSGIDTLSLIIADSALQNGKLEALQADLREAVSPDAIEVDPNLALIAVVGRGMMHQPGRSGTLFAALGTAGVNVRMIDQGSSELNIIVGVNESEFETAVRAIYDAFIR